MNFQKLKKISLFLGLCLLAYLVWPKYERFQCKSQQSEAKAWLIHLYEAEQYHFAKQGKYISLEELRKENLIPEKKGSYEYSSHIKSDKSFQIQATSHDNAQFPDDIWAIDQFGKVQAISDACAGMTVENS